MKQDLVNLARKYPVAVVLLVIVIAVSLIAENYFSGENIFNVLRQISVIGILSCGMTFVIISGGIDLSVGAIISFAGALFINSVKQFGTIPAILVTLLAGILFGFISGTIISKINGKLGESFMVTYGMQTVIVAITLLYTGGIYQSAPNDELFTRIGRGIAPILIFVVIVSIMQFILTKSRFGRRVYFLGGNTDASRLSGIRVGLNRLAVFAISGLLAAAAAIVLTSRVGTASPTAGVGYELDAIAAVVVGGVSMSGGQGSILNTLLGVIIMGVLGNALNMLNISAYPQLIMKGVIIVLSVTLDAWNRRKDVTR